MHKQQRTALRFAAYIRAMGGEPIPFRHGSHREWALDLQRQHERLRRSVDPGFAKAAKARARDLIRRKGYRRAVEDATPIQIGVSDTKHDCVPSSPVPQGAATTAAATQSASETERTSLDTACGRKLFHPDVWSAIVHARRLGGGVHVYICECGGAHVGHPQDERTPEYRRGHKRLRVIERRLVALGNEWRVLLSEKNQLMRDLGEPDSVAAIVSEFTRCVRRLLGALTTRRPNLRLR